MAARALYCTWQRSAEQWKDVTRRMAQRKQQRQEGTAMQQPMLCNAERFSVCDLFGIAHVKA